MGAKKTTRLYESPVIWDMEKNGIFCQVEGFYGGQGGGTLSITEAIFRVPKKAFKYEYDLKILHQKWGEFYLNFVFSEEECHI